MRFRARELREGIPQDELRRELNAIQKEIRADIEALSSRSKVSPLLIDGPYAASYGEIVRVAPPSGGFRLILPPKNLEQPNARVTVVVEGSAGALTAEAVDATVNGSDTLALLPGIGTVEFVLSPTGWYAFSATLFSVPLASLPGQAADTFLGRLSGAGVPAAQSLSALAGAGLAYASNALAVTGSTSITVASDEVRRAALTGEATAPVNDNAVTVTRSTNYQSSPWTGDHQFNGELRLGTLHTENGATGSINITLTAGASRILINSTGAVTIGTISGAADGRVCIVEHVRTSGSGDLSFTHGVGVNEVACPGSATLTLTGNRSGCLLVCRNQVWRVVAHTN